MSELLLWIFTMLNDGKTNGGRLSTIAKQIGRQSVEVNWGHQTVQRREVRGTYILNVILQSIREKCVSLPNLQ